MSLLLSLLFDTVQQTVDLTVSVTVQRADQLPNVSSSLAAMRVESAGYQPGLAAQHQASDVDYGASLVCIALDTQVSYSESLVAQTPATVPSSVSLAASQLARDVGVGESLAVQSMGLGVGGTAAVVVRQIADLSWSATLTALATTALNVSATVAAHHPDLVAPYTAGISAQSSGQSPAYTGSLSPVAALDSGYGSSVNALGPAEAGYGTTTAGQYLGNELTAQSSLVVQQQDRVPQSFASLVSMAITSPQLTASLAARQQQEAGESAGLAAQVPGVSSGYAGSVVVSLPGDPSVTQSLTVVSALEAGEAARAAVYRSNQDVSSGESLATAHVQAPGWVHSITAARHSVAVESAASVYAIGAGGAGFQESIAAQSIGDPPVYASLVALTGQASGYSTSVVTIPRQLEGAYGASVYLSGVIYGALRYGASMAVAFFYRRVRETPIKTFERSVPVDRHGDATPL